MVIRMYVSYTVGVQHINTWMYSSLHSLSMTQQSRLQLETLPSRLASFMENASSIFGGTERSINEVQMFHQQN